MGVHINTNFTLFDKEKSSRIVDLGIDHLTVSLWAGTPDTYSNTHPNKSEETFHHIYENLKYLASIKNKRPFIKVYNVISKINYFEIDKMVDFAIDCGVDSVEFTMVDTVPGHTDSLLLSEIEQEQLIELCHQVKEKVDALEHDDINHIVLFRFEEFIRRVSTNDTLFGNYDKNVIDSIPCYAGWYFARILPDGNVNSCLKSHRIPVGNIYNKSFRDIWISKKQEEFRCKTLVNEKVDPYFRQIGNDPSAKVGCYKSCDNLGHNQHVHNRLETLSFKQKKILKIGGKFIKSYN